MELWIRSQNKETLVKVDDLCIDNNEDNKEAFDIVQGCILLGTYMTKERALEILDNIQNILMLKYATVLNLGAVVKNKNVDEMAKLLMEMAVYEMPEK